MLPTTIEDREFQKFEDSPEGPIVRTQSGNFAKRIDETSASVNYIGIAKIGSSNADPVWQIQKITVVSKITSTFWADGDDNFDNVWNNRASLTYL